jgi:hypothetical protein
MANIAGCGCASNLKNTGNHGQKLFGYMTGVYLVPKIGSDGNPNKIDLTSATLGADILARVNATDPRDRFYPIQELENVATTEAEATFETSATGVREKLFDGVKNFTAQKWGISNQYFANVQSACVEFGILQIDNCGNVRGQKIGTDLYPRYVNKDSYDAMFMDKTTEGTSKVSFNFDFERSTNDADQWVVFNTEMQDFNATSAKGLLDVNLGITVDSATQLTIVASLNYGSAVTQVPVTNLVLADFVLNNVTTPAVITPSAVVEGVDGTYVVTIPAQTTSDLVTVDVFKAGTNMTNGYDGIMKTITAL